MTPGTNQLSDLVAPAETSEWLDDRIPFQDGSHGEVSVDAVFFDHWPAICDNGPNPVHKNSRQFIVCGGAADHPVMVRLDDLDQVEICLARHQRAKEQRFCRCIDHLNVEAEVRVA